jgi:uncharacterized membrane protein YcaP (DUF421 family)
MFADMFVLQLSILEKILRPVIVYVAIVVLLRIFGKRELAQLNPFDLVVLLSISNTVQNAIIGNDNSLTGGLIGAVALFAINYLVVRFLFRHRRLDQVLGGTPTTLIDRGVILKDALSRELISESDLLIVAHRQGFENLGEIEHCVLEPGGTFAMRGTQPPARQRRQHELTVKLDQISHQIEELRQRLPQQGTR